MIRTSGIIGCILVSLVAVACTAPADEGDVTSSESAVTGLRAVDVIVSAKRTGENYEARAYPVDDVNNDGFTEYYNAPVYYVYVEGTNAAGKRERREWKAPRYMPYNNPAGERYESSYKTKGFVTAGLSNVPRMAAPAYKPDYQVHNRFSPFGGAIVVKGAFYIHAGPEDVKDAGWGSAGCVEIIGDFDGFKRDILELSGSPAASGDAETINQGMSQLVAGRKLFITYQSAARPNIKALFSRQVGYAEESITVTADAPNEPTEPTVSSEPASTLPPETVLPAETSTDP